MRQQRTIGAIIRLVLDDEHIIYGRILPEASFAFYDSITKTEIEDLADIVSKPILFIVAVYNDAVTRGRWQKVGKIPLEEQLKRLPLRYIQDVLQPDRFELYDNGEIRPATQDECIGLEQCAVWEAEHVEERLRDHYAGRVCKWLKVIV